MESFQSKNRKQIKAPDLPEEIYNDQNKTIGYSTSNPPPFLSTTERIVSEAKNSDPNFMRSTMYTFPTSEYTLEACGLPLSLIFTPFNDKGVFNLISELDYCKFCRSCVNCFTAINNNGSFTCNICQKLNDSPIKNKENIHFSSLEALLPMPLTESPKFKNPGQNNSAEEASSELFYPQVNFVNKPVFIFMFDMMSPNLVASSLEIIENLTRDKNFQFLYEKVGFLVMNGGIMTFCCSNGHVKKIRMPCEVPFISPRILFDSSDSHSISQIIDEIKKFKERKTMECNVFVDCVRHISAFSVASKIAVFSSQPLYINYEDVLSDVKNSCINLFKIDQADILPKKPNNTFDELSFYSSGSVFKYSQNNFARLNADIESIALVKAAFNVDFVLKASNNVFKNHVIGSTLYDNLTFSHFNHMTGNIPVTFGLGISGICKATKYVQLQIKFTDYDGTRKMRLLNHSFPTGLPSQVFSNLSFDTIFAALVKRHIFDESDLEKALTSFLVYYRSKCSNNTSNSQFVLPESIKCLPALIQAFYKKNAIEKSKLVNFNVEQNLRYFYPRLFSLSEYALKSKLLETRQLRLSVNSLNEEDIYILENSQTIFIYVPRSVDREFVRKLFKTDSNGRLCVIKSEDEENVILNNIIEEINTHYNMGMNVEVCIAGDSLNEPDFLMFMCEDSLNSLPDYVDYIFKLHFKVQKG